MKIEDKKIIFCHIDKTAGSSISKSLNPTLNIHTHTEPIQRPDKHATMKQLILNVDNPNEYFKIAFVRDPYDRALSKYFHHKRDTFGTPLEASAKNLDFNEWVKRGGLNLFRPQYMYVYDDNGRNLCDFIGRFENLESDYNILKEKFNLDKLASINHNDLKKVVNVLDYYNNESLEIINKKYEKDFILFNYTKVETI